MLVLESSLITPPPNMDKHTGAEYNSTRTIAVAVKLAYTAGTAATTPSTPHALEQNIHHVPAETFEAEESDSLTEIIYTTPLMLSPLLTF